MAKNTDWMPTRRHEQLAMAKNWASLFATKGTAWEIDTGETMILNTKITKAEEVMKIAQSSERTDSTTALLNMRFKDLCDFMRFLRQRKFYKPLMTDADFIDLGLKIPDTIKTTVPAPTDIARGSIELTIRKRHAIAFPAEDSGKTAWFALRVENGKGGKGPWGEMFSAIIP